MRIEGKRIIAFIIKKTDKEYVIHLADTENRLDDGYKKTRIGINSENIDRISNMFSNDKYAFVGFGNKYNDNIIINYVIKNKDVLKNCNVNYITTKLGQILEDTLKGDDELLQKEYKYANMFNSFDLQRFLLSKDEMVSLEQFVKSSDFKYTDEEHDIDNICNILDENTNRINARLKIEEIYNEDLFEKHESVAGARLMKSLYLKKNKLKWSEIKDKHNDVKYIKFSDIILPNIKFKDDKLNKFLEDLKKETISPTENWWMCIPFKKILLNINLAGLRMNTPPIKLESDQDGDVYNIDVASFFPSIADAYKIKPLQVNDTFLEIYHDMLTRRLEFKKTDKDCSDCMKLMLVGVIGQFMIENSWLYDPEASLKIRINGALLMLMLVEMIYDVAEIYCVTIDGMFIKSFGTGNFEKIRYVVDEWSELSKLNADIVKYNSVYMLSNNDYIADTTVKGFFSYKGNNGHSGIPEIIRIAVSENLTHGTPIASTITSFNNIDAYLTSTTSKDTLEWNGELFKSARYYYSNDQKLCKIEKKSDFAEPEQIPITDYGVTIVNEIPDKKPDNINYQYYISEANRIANKIKVQQLNLF